MALPTLPEQGIVILPVLGIGIILGLYELFLIHKDLDFRGSRWLTHGIHSVGLMWIALFAIFNTEFFLNVTGLINSNIPLISSPLAVRIAIGLILNFKMHATSAVIKGSVGGGGNLAEHWTHTIIVSALAVGAPYYWPFLAPLLPSYLGGTGGGN